MRAQTLWMLVICGGLFSFCFAESIHIKKNSYTKDELVKLTEVCEFNGFSSTSLKKLENCFLGRAPDYGQERKITREDIKSALHRLNINTMTITFTGEEFCVVKRVKDEEKNLLKAQIRERIVTFLYEKEEMKFMEVECEVIDVEILGYENKKAELTFVGFEPKQTIEPGRFRLKGDCIDSEGNLVPIYAFVDLKFFANVVVAKRFLPAGRLIVSSDIGIEKRQIHKEQEFFTSTKDIEGLKVAKSVEKGTIIDSTMVKGALLIKKKDYVVATYKGNGFQSSVLMIALDDGTLNDIVRIQNPISKQVTYGRVVGRGQVEILGETIDISNFRRK